MLQKWVNFKEEIPMTLQITVERSGVESVKWADGDSTRIKQHELKIFATDLAVGGSFVCCAGRVSGGCLHADSACGCGAFPAAATAPLAVPVASATPALLAPQKPAESEAVRILHGIASWYGGVFNGRRTASGEVFDMNAMTACHPTLPCDRVRRARAVRRKIRRRGARRRDGRGRRQHHGLVGELCGGTHVRRTGDIGLISVFERFRRRLRRAPDRGLDRAGGAGKCQQQLARLAKATASELRVPLEDVPGRVATLLDERKRLERELSEMKKKLAMGGGGKAEDGDGGIATVDGVKVMAKTLSGVDAKDLRSLADEGKKKLGSGVVALIAVDPEGKAALVVGVTADLAATDNAVQLVQVGVAALGGKGGGGRPDMAQGGGPNGGAAEAALAAITKLVKPA